MNVGTEERPLRVAIVGSGPAGIYAAGQLLTHAELSARVDVFDRLATPWGLVRFGVAPDHPKIKSVTKAFEKTAERDGFRFFGNVEIGEDLSHEELMSAYDAVIYCVGTASDRRLDIPGEDLAGSAAATEFVAWYNGHPDYAEAEFDLSGERAVVIGNGNVALDVARMLALSADELGRTDTADHAIAALAKSEITEIVVLGRRGPAQAAFTNPELRELVDLELADVIVDATEATLDPASEAALESAHPTAKRNVETLGKYAALTPQGKPRRIVLRFLVSPLEIQGDERVEAVVVAKNELVERDGSLRPQTTEETERIETGLVLRSVGYIGTPLPGVPFDADKLRILNDEGRVLDTDSHQPLPGVYTAGWIKRGPSGVIGTNKKDATETVAKLLEDLAAGTLPDPQRTPDELIAQLRERDHVLVEYDGWRAIDAHERGRGEPDGRPRVKLVDRLEQLAVAAGEKLEHA